MIPAVRQRVWCQVALDLLGFYLFDGLVGVSHGGEVPNAQQRDHDGQQCEQAVDHEEYDVDMADEVRVVLLDRQKDRCYCGEQQERGEELVRGVQGVLLGVDVDEPAERVDAVERTEHDEQPLRERPAVGVHERQSDEPQEQLETEAIVDLGAADAACQDDVVNDSDDAECHQGCCIGLLKIQIHAQSSFSSSDLVMSTLAGFLLSAFARAAVDRLSAHVDR